MRPEFLTRLAEADRHATPPAMVESRLRQAVRARKGRSKSLGFAMIAVAAGLLLIAMFVRKPSSTGVTPVTVPEAIVEQHNRIETPEPDAPSLAMQATSATRRARPRPMSAAAKPVDSQETVTRFYALTADAREVRPGSQMMRVRLPRAAMTSFGLPVNTELAGGHVNADVIVGDDGIAQAIRFVRSNP